MYAVLHVVLHITVCSITCSIRYNCMQYYMLYNISHVGCITCSIIYHMYAVLHDVSHIACMQYYMLYYISHACSIT